MTTRKQQPKGDVDRIAQRRQRYQRTRQKVWTCPTCRAIHRGFAAEQCRNIHCDDYQPPGGKE